MMSRSDNSNSDRQSNRERPAPVPGLDRDDGRQEVEPGHGPAGSPPQPPFPRPWLTYSILALCGVLYFLSREPRSPAPSLETLVRFGAKVNHLIDAGQAWRLFSAMFLHANNVHLLVNLISLYSLGRGLEPLLGTRRFLCLYVLSGLSGSLVSWFYSPAIAVGASGAMFGLFGTSLVHQVKVIRILRRRGLPGISGPISNLVFGLFLLAINLSIGLIYPNIDNASHAGGLLAGVVLGMATGAVWDGRPVSPWLNGVSTGCLLALVWSAVMAFQFAASTPQAEVKREVDTARKAYTTHLDTKGGAVRDWIPGAAQSHFRRGVIHHERKELAEAEAAYQKAVSLKPELWEAWFNLGIIYLERREFHRAKEMFLRVKELQPKVIDARLNLALVYEQMGSSTLAHEELLAAVEADPNNGPAHRELGRSLDRLGDTEGAMAHCQEALRLSPDDARVRLYVGVLHVKKGNEDAARQQLQWLQTHDKRLAEQLERAVRARFGASPRTTP